MKNLPVRQCVKYLLTQFFQFCMCMIKLDLRVSHFVQARFIIAYYIHNQNGGVLQLFLREGETKAIYLPHETSINHFFKNN